MCGFKVYNIPFHNTIEDSMKRFKDGQRMSEEEYTFQFYHDINGSPLTGNETPASLSMSNAPPGESGRRRNWIKLWTQKKPAPAPPPPV